MMRFRNAGVVPVRWYWTDLPLIDRPTIYGSQFWIAEEERPDFDDGTLGEVFGSERPYRKGQAPVGVNGTLQGSEGAWMGEPEAGESLYLPCGTWPYDYDGHDYDADWDSLIFSEIP
jgi:hypothetical protein